MKGILFVGNFLSGTTLNRSYAEDLSDRMEARGWPVIRTSTRPGRIARLADMLSTAWKRRHDYAVAQVDVFSGPSFVWAEAVCFELRRLGKPYILTLHGGNLPQFQQRWPRRTRRLLESAAQVTVPSPYLREQMQSSRRDLTLLRNAIEADAYGFRTRSDVRPRLVWLRAFHDIYNPVLAVEVLARLAASRPDATLAMVGPDKDGSRAMVEQRADELGVRDRLTLVGHVARTEVPRYLGDADVFLNTTNVDNTPLSVLEAMAAGLCVVTTSVGGIPYLVEDGRNALVVPPRDAAAMAGATERVLADPALANRLSCGGHELARACDWKPVLAQWESMVQAVAP